MPEIARFFGIAIYMYFNDHAPPHLHARQGRAKAAFRLDDGAVLRGELSKTATRMVRDWILDHRVELEENWQRAQAGAQPEKIPGPDGRE